MSATTEYNKGLILRFVEQLVVRGDVSGPDEMVGADYVDHGRTVGLARQPGSRSPARRVNCGPHFGHTKLH